MAGHTSAPQFLTRVLKWNSGFSLLSGLALVLAAAPLAGMIAPQLGTILGMPFPAFLRLLGLGVIAFAAAVWYVAVQQKMPRWQVWAIASLDVDWVLGSIAALIFAGGHFSWAGKMLIVDIAVVVAAFAALELFGLLRREAGAGLQSLPALHH